MQPAWWILLLASIPGCVVLAIGTAVLHSRFSRPFAAFRLGGYIGLAGLSMAVLPFAAAVLIPEQFTVLGLGLYALNVLAAVSLIRDAQRLGFNRRSFQPMDVVVALAGGLLVNVAAFWRPWTT